MKTLVRGHCILNAPKPTFMNSPRGVLAMSIIAHFHYERRHRHRKILIAQEQLRALGNVFIFPLSQSRYPGMLGRKRTAPMHSHEHAKSERQQTKSPASQKKRRSPLEAFTPALRVPAGPKFFVFRTKRVVKPAYLRPDPILKTDTGFLQRSCSLSSSTPITAMLSSED